MLLALLAVPGAENLRRGAANALGWFGIMFFGLAALFMWFAWSATLTDITATSMDTLRVVAAQ